VGGFRRNATPAPIRCRLGFVTADLGCIRLDGGAGRNQEVVNGPSVAGRVGVNLSRGGRNWSELWHGERLQLSASGECGGDGKALQGVQKPPCQQLAIVPPALEADSSHPGHELPLGGNPKGIASNLVFGVI
jgi:hypothetical protein